MLVEITRLLVVTLLTAAGLELGRVHSPASGTGALAGAALGAGVGYVLGGIVGRLLRTGVGEVDRRIGGAPAASLLAGALGGVAVGGLGAVLGLPVLLFPPRWPGWAAYALIVWIGASAGAVVAARKAEQLLGLAGLSTRPLALARPWSGSDGAFLVDTSAVIDGRLLALARTGFLRGSLLVAPFVLDELQGIADAQDPVRRRRGRRGLETLDALSRVDVTVHVLDDEVVEHQEVDAKLVALARRLRVPLLTVDGPLQRVAELRGVRCLNPDNLSDDLRAEHVPGEVIRLPIARPGREDGQGVGYLDDGTMVVVGDAACHVGSEVDVRVTSQVQTSVGRMLFAALASHV